MRNPEIEKALLAFQTMTMETFVQQYPEAFAIAGMVDTLIAQALPVPDQIIALTMSFGVLLSSFESETCEADEHGIPVTFEDRIEVMIAMLGIIRRDFAQFMKETRPNQQRTH